MRLTGITVVPILYLDIDGTVRYGKDQLGVFISEASQVIVWPEAVEEMIWWKTLGGKIIGVSNQGGVALGYMSMEACTDTMRRTNELTGNLFDAIVWCPHHPNASDPLLARCWCRKPRIGLLVESQLRMTLETNYKEIYPIHLAVMIGDRNDDRDCAREANIDFMWADAWRAGQLREIYQGSQGVQDDKRVVFPRPTAEGTV